MQWGSWENNFATWIATEPGADERDAIARGRVFFGDPLRFRGRVAIEVDGEPAGSVVPGVGPRTVDLRVERPGEGALVRLISDEGLLREWSASGDANLRHELKPGAARFVRAEVRGPGGDPLAFTNPIYFDPAGQARRGVPGKKDQKR